MYALCRTRSNKPSGETSIKQFYRKLTVGEGRICQQYHCENCYYGDCCFFSVTYCQLPGLRVMISLKNAMFLENSIIKTCICSSKSSDKGSCPEIYSYKCG